VGLDSCGLSCLSVRSKTSCVRLAERYTYKKLARTGSCLEQEIITLPEIQGVLDLFCTSLPRAYIVYHNMNNMIRTLDNVVVNFKEIAVLLSLLPYEIIPKYVPIIARLNTNLDDRTIESILYSDTILNGASSYVEALLKNGPIGQIYSKTKTFATSPTAIAKAILSIITEQPASTQLEEELSTEDQRWQGYEQRIQTLEGKVGAMRGCRCNEVTIGKGKAPEVGGDDEGLEEVSWGMEEGSLGFLNHLPPGIWGETGNGKYVKCTGSVDDINNEEDPRREQIALDEDTALELQESFEAEQDHYLKQSLPLEDLEDEEDEMPNQPEQPEQEESSGARHVRFSPLVTRYGEGGPAHRKPYSSIHQKHF